MHTVNSTMTAVLRSTALAAGLVILGAAAAAAPTVRVVAEHPTFELLGQVGDVRWLGERSLLLAAGTEGTFELQLAPPFAPKLLLPASAGSAPEASKTPAKGLIRAHVRAAASEKFLAVADYAFGLAWLTRGSAEQPLVFPHHHCYGLDMHGTRLLLTGLPSAEAVQEHGFAVAWEAELGSEPLRFSPRHVLTRRGYRTPGEFIQVTDWLLTSMAAHARYLPDGSVVILPGVEPGAFLYGPDGRLRRAWDQEVVGTDVAWGSAAEGRRVHLDDRERFAWSNTRRLAEELLPLAEGPALLVREVREERTH